MPLGPQGFYNRLEHHHEGCDDKVVINWNLGNRCNFECSYCPDSLNNGSFGWNDYEVVTAFIDQAIAHYAPRLVYFEFTGGEVTLWKDFVKTAKYIKRVGHDVGFISNGSRTIRWWEKNKEIFDHVCLSFHPEAADPEHFAEVVKIMSQECRTHCNIMMHTDLAIWDKCVEVADRVIDIKNISIALQPLIVNFSETLYTYSDNQLTFIDRQWDNYGSKIRYDKTWKLFRGSMDMVDTVNDLKKNSSAHRFINDKTNNWKGWDCWAGVEQIVVDFDGSVMRGWCRVDGVLGFIQHPDSIRWPTKPVRCNKSMCHCNFDIMSTKELPADRYIVLHDIEDEDGN